MVNFKSLAESIAPKVSSDNFTYTSNDDGVTVNGKRYATLEDVPAEVQARIKELQDQFGPESALMKEMLGTGKPVSRSTSTMFWSTKKGSKTITRTRQTSTSTSDSVADASRAHEHQPGPINSEFISSNPGEHASPGEVPRTSVMRRLWQFGVLVIVVAAIWMCAQALGVL